MKREWKPGDVAAISIEGGDEWTAIRLEGCWHGERSKGSGQVCWRDDTVTARPLVVIDPENREQIQRLISLWTQSEVGKAMSFADGLQDALRNLLEPPAPDEPTDPKARVTDRRENIWRLLADGDWVCTSGPDIGEYLLWWQLAERGPLSIEGVS